MLEQYQRALGGVDAIKGVRSETRHGEVEAVGMPGKSTFIAYAKAFRTLAEVTRPDGQEIISGFDGRVSWTITPRSEHRQRHRARRGAPGRRSAICAAPARLFPEARIRRRHRLRGPHLLLAARTTNWGKDNNQFYDVHTGLLAGYRFQSDDSSSTSTTALFEDDRHFGGPLVPTRMTARTGEHGQTVTVISVSYEPLADSLFELPAAIKALLK